MLVKSGFKLIIIDDNEDLVMNLKDILEVQEYSVASALDGQSALKLHETGTFDLALVDINLPDFSGEDLIKHLMTLSHEHEYFIIMTGHASLEGAINAVGQKNLIGYVTKPLDMDNLLFLIDQVYQRRQTERALNESEERFRMMVNSMEEIVFTLDKEMRYTAVYGPWVKKFGLTQADFIGKTAAEVFGEHDAATHYESNLRSLAGEFVVYEWETVHDGNIRYFQTSLSPLRDDEQNIVGIVGIGRDITERKEAEGLFRIIAMNSPVGVYIVQQGKFVYTNPQFQKDTGYTEDELKDMDSLDLVVPEEREMVRWNAINMIKGRRTLPYEYKTVNKQGSVRWSRETVAPIIYRRERATIGSYQDITEQKKMQENLIVTDRLASVGELAAGIAHELNNPLTGVIGFSDLLMVRDDIPEEIREDLETINHEAVRASKVARHLLTFARKHSDEKTPVNVNALIENTLTLRAYEQKVHNIEVKADLAENLPEIVANGFQLQQVFINIIINAEHFMIEENGKGLLTIQTEALGDTVCISITDDGPGIPPSAIPHIFDPFFTTKEVGKGTGLGLSICYGIITEHSGELTVESEVGRGTTFRMTLPVTNDQYYPDERY